MITSQKTINWGILGPGRIAEKFAHDLRLAENATLKAVASRDLERASVFASAYGAPQSYGTYEELATDPTIDVIYVATPHVFHFEHSMMCLKAGKSVLCEKPLGMNAREVSLMVKQAKSSGVFFMEGIWTRFIPGMEKVVELLEQGVIGDLQTVRADFGFKADQSKKRLFDPELGGGALLDVGIYPVYLSLLTLGKPSSIKATATFTSSNVDSYCAMLFDYQGDQKAVLEASIQTETPTEAYLFGELGSIKLHSRFHHPEQITLAKSGQTDQFFELPYSGFGYYHEILEVGNCLSKGAMESNKMPLQLSIDLCETLDQIRNEIGLTYPSDL